MVGATWEKNTRLVPSSTALEASPKMATLNLLTFQIWNVWQTIRVKYFHNKLHYYRKIPCNTKCNIWLKHIKLKTHKQGTSKSTANSEHMVNLSFMSINSSSVVTRVRGVASMGLEGWGKNKASNNNWVFLVLQSHVYDIVLLSVKIYHRALEQIVKWNITTRRNEK